MNSKIFKRREKILSSLTLKEKVFVKDLAQSFDLSEETIRRDIEALHREKKLKKVHGGAVILPKYEVATYFEDRINLNFEEKKLIAKKAAEFIEDNDTISLEYGSTVYQILEFIKDRKNLTIVTNSVLVLNEILKLRQSNEFYCKFIFLGGELNENYMATTGILTEETLRNLKINKAFVSCDGLSLNLGLNTCYLQDAALAKLYLKNTNKSYILVDSSKINKELFYKVADLSQLENIICDINPSKHWQKAIERKRINWIKA